MVESSAHAAIVLERRHGRVIAVMPAYNAESTLEKTVADIPQESVDEIILVDDHSIDRTVEIAERLGLSVYRHNENKGYGANQKTCYDMALEKGAHIVVMIHPDYQYDPRIIPYAMGFISTGMCDVIIGSRIRDRKEALKAGMPLYKYLGNRILTFIENLVLGQNLGDFHSGFRIFKREVLERINYSANSNNFVFDTEILAQAVYCGFKIGDVPISVRYFPEASSINLSKSLKYGLNTLVVMMKYMIQKSKLYQFRVFETDPDGT